MRNRIWLLLSLFATGITCLYVTKVLTPWNQQRGEVTDGIKTQMGDLFAPWMGAHELLVHGRNPYSPEVSHEIQMAFYGRVVSQGESTSSGRLINEQRFAYPLYTVFILAPTVGADFAVARRWARFTFGLLTAISVMLCLDILRWRPAWPAVAALILFTLSSPQIVQGLRFEQLAMAAGFLLVAAAWCVRKNHLATSGVLLALATIKPQMALLPLCWFAVWSVGDWRQRWRLPAGFAGTLLVLITAGELLLRGWIGYFLSGVAAYRKYAPTTSLLRVALGDTLGEIAGGVLVFGLLLMAWKNRKHTADSQPFSATLGAFLIVAVLAFPLFTPFNQVLLIFPVILLIREWQALPRFSRLVFIVSASWPWAVSCLLLLFANPTDAASQLPLLPSFLVLFFPLFLPLLLMTGKVSVSSHESSRHPL